MSLIKVDFSSLISIIFTFISVVSSDTLLSSMVHVLFSASVVFWSNLTGSGICSEL